ncbi:pentatricopeptide repeat-containing protein At2g42920, chloroplastic-like [Zingiber officinale]|uniref:pentatricopeptide repeat-containing protein At2g42920, chloroplastic-like n=1 Tax=Zingiber officinale TaxID=94328 RepID=UPI001C4B166B|nr:pentatricopeptide repeat-containing protein At2g42920, chloroplastic-like [Zingiber officinale]
MRQKSTMPDAYTFQFMFKSCTLVGLALEGQMVHALFVKHFPDCDAFVANSLVYMYVQLDCIDDAVIVFRLIDMKDVVSWTTIIEGLVKSGFVDDAPKLFNEMPVRNVISSTSLIADHAKYGMASKVVGVFKEMMSKNVEPNTIAMVAVLSACAQLRDLKLGKWLHQIVIDKRIGVSSNLAVALINMYAKGGSIMSARQIFDSMNNKIAPAWNAIIDGYYKIGYINIARSLFEKMNAPDIISFNSMITGYIHGGRLKEALQLFSK